MKALVFIAAAFFAAPLLAQTAVTLDFSIPQTSANGVEVRASDAFTEYRSGIWQSAVSGAQAPETTMPTEAGNLSAKTAGGGCEPSAVPRYVPGLRREVAVRRLTWWRTVAVTECRYGIPQGLLDALVLQESQYHPTAVSPVGAIGLAQLMPGTAGDLGVADSFNPSANLDGGARYLRDMMTKFRSVPLALAAYNAGPGAVRSAGGIPANGETPGYVRRVLGYWSSTGLDDLASVRRTAVRLGFTDPTED